MSGDPVALGDSASYGQPVLSNDTYRMVPFHAPIDADVSLPGSKSYTNRALLVAALASGTSTLTGVLFSDDTLAMLSCLDSLEIPTSIDRRAKTVSIVGCGGQPVVDGRTLNVRQSGTTARFVLPMVAIGRGRVVVDGHPQMRARPMRDLVEPLDSLGARIEGEGLPFTVHGGIRGGGVRVRGDVSSQFLSGLLLSGPCFPDGLVIDLTTELVSKPYVDMTLSVMRAFGARVESDGYRKFSVAASGYQATTYAIEPDASAASYFFAAAAITRGRVRVNGLGTSSLQGDRGFASVLGRMGATVLEAHDFTEVRGARELHGIDVDMSDLSDTAQTLATTAVFATGVTIARGIGFIRKKETDRIAAVVAELQRCGVDASEDDDGFTIKPPIAPTSIPPTVVHTYDDHRMAMSFALLGLVIEGIEIENPACTAKTFPDFWEVLESTRPPLRILAIDGVLGSGKTTVARQVAAKLGVDYLDTGAMYRCVGLACLRAGVDPSHAEHATAFARRASIDIATIDGTQRVTLDGFDVSSEIRTPEATRASSIVATHPGVRAAMVEQQRMWGRRRGGGVVEGRDIATVVFPEAPVKVFLTADVHERARRRLLEQPERTLDEVLADLEWRDRQDSTREADPLRVADHATIVDTTGLSIDDVVSRLVTFANIAFDALARNA